MRMTKEEQYGQLILTNIFGSVWLGDWDHYEEIFKEMDEGLKGSFPFHSEYVREMVKLWYENHFLIPGDYFISPYFSSYTSKNNIGAEEGKRDLLCLIGMYEKLGFYFPLHQDLYPDHIGCLTTFLAAVMQEKLKADEEDDRELLYLLSELEDEIALKYILPIGENIYEKEMNRIQHPFFEQFLSYYMDVMREQYFQRPQNNNEIEKEYIRHE